MTNNPTDSALTKRINLLEERCLNLRIKLSQVRVAARDLCYEARSDTAVFIVLEPLITKLEKLLAYPEPEEA